jgi:hypothetical protein
VQLPREMAAGSWQLLSAQVHAELTVAGSRATKMSGAGKVAAPIPDVADVAAETDVAESDVWRAARERRRAAPPRPVSRRPPGRNRS